MIQRWAHCQRLYFSLMKQLIGSFSSSFPVVKTYGIVNDEIVFTSVAVLLTSHLLWCYDGLPFEVVIYSICQWMLGFQRLWVGMLLVCSPLGLKILLPWVVVCGFLY